mmetsp:Transcript_2003/g.5236  ORF Transcript_2003/g.5236 Transcript_2003/m.5236 type:complete len:147 (-) Transcript_2003:425-865(-)
MTSSSHGLRPFTRQPSMRLHAISLATVCLLIGVVALTISNDPALSRTELDETSSTQSATPAVTYAVVPQVPLFSTPPTPVLVNPYELPPRAATLDAQLLPGAEKYYHPPEDTSDDQDSAADEDDDSGRLIILTIFTLIFVKQIRDR